MEKNCEKGLLNKLCNNYFYNFKLVYFCIHGSGQVDGGKLLEENVLTTPANIQDQIGTELSISESVRVGMKGNGSDPSLLVHLFACRQQCLLFGSIYDRHRSGDGPGPATQHLGSPIESGW